MNTSAPTFVRDDAWTQIGERLGFKEIPGIAIDHEGIAYVLGRDPGCVIRVRPDGTELDRWGEGHFIRPHCIVISPYEEAAFCVCDYSHSVQKFTLDGRLLMTIESQVPPSYTGYTRGDTMSVRRAGPPFCFPTAITFGGSDELVVSDGYGNARIHRFDAAGRLLQSFGEPGCEPGQFRLPHGVLVETDRILVADRENNRIQIFDREGTFLDLWADCRRPSNIIKVDGYYLVSELGWVNRAEGTKRFIEPSSPSGRITVRDNAGVILSEFTPCGTAEPDTWFAPHGIASDAQGNIFTTETYVTFFRGQAPHRPALHHFKRQLAAPDTSTQTNS